MGLLQFDWSTLLYSWFKITVARNTHSQSTRELIPEVPEELIEDPLPEELQGNPGRVFTVPNSPEQGDGMDVNVDNDNGEGSSATQQIAGERAAAEARQHAQEDTNVPSGTGAGMAPPTPQDTEAGMMPLTCLNDENDDA